MASPLWQRKRAVALATARNRCQVCNASQRLDVHHRTYERFGGNETPGDLTVLCRSCHDLFHNAARGIAQPEPAPAKNLTAPNGSRLRDLPDAQLQILRVLRREGPLRATELAQVCGRTTGKTGAALHKLRSYGHVSKKAKLWSITGRGRRYVVND